VALAATAAARHTHLRGLGDEVEETVADDDDDDDGVDRTDMLALQTWMFTTRSSVSGRFGRRPVFRACLHHGQLG
jgi:hypothetical protein